MASFESHTRVCVENSTFFFNTPLSRVWPGHLSSDGGLEDVEEEAAHGGGEESLLWPRKSSGHPGGDTRDPGDHDDQVVIHIEMVEQRHGDHRANIAHQGLT